MPDARELLLANLALVDRVVAWVCRRRGLSPDETEEFGGVVRLKLVEDDYAVIRKFEGRSSFSTFITVVIQRLLLDDRIHTWGKWHPSAVARRMGDRAIELERLLIRDGKTFDEACAWMSSRDPSSTRESLAAIAAQLPERAPKRRVVALEETDREKAAQPDEVSLDQTRLSEKVSAVVSTFVERLPADDRLVMKLRFGSGMTVAQIARSLRLDQKQLYRRIERYLREVREELDRHGIAADEASALIGDRGILLDFRLENDAPRPSIRDEGTIVDGQEVSR
jgi:RNA polymerase sigma factor (sigma-70 family)